MNLYLNELGKAFRKLNGTKMPAELVLIGGASALANYGFRAARVYKHDLSDIVGIIGAQKQMKKPLTPEEVTGAYATLYGDADSIDAAVLELTRHALAADDCTTLYAACVADEAENKEVLQWFEKQYPKALKQENLTNILQELKQKKRKALREFDR